MEFTPADFVNAGVNILSVYLIYRLMNRLDVVTDRIFAWLERADAQRAVLLRLDGVDPNDSGIYRREDVGLPSPKDQE